LALLANAGHKPGHLVVGLARRLRAAKASMIQRSPISGLVRERCPQCSNILDRSTTGGLLPCHCAFGICISCRRCPATAFNLCSLCEDRYLWHFKAHYFRPPSARSVDAWIRQRYWNLGKRRGVVGSLEEFRYWFLCAHRSFRLHYQTRSPKFTIHRALDRGRYRVLKADRNIYMVPYDENNSARSYCRIDERSEVLAANAQSFTYPQISDLLGVPLATAHRWVERGDTMAIEPQTIPYYEYPPRPSKDR
jgi:hypothetical protein